MITWGSPDRSHWHNPGRSTEMPRTWQEAADTKQERDAIEADITRSQDEINDRKEDWKHD